MMNKKPLILFCIPILVWLSGCATIPSAENLPIYNLNGVAYLPLTSLCQARGINLEYDPFTRIAILTKDIHRINLRAGDNLILVDNKPSYLKHPVEVYQGALAVPYRFKEQILDSLFKPYAPAARVYVPITAIKKVVIDAGHGGTDPGAIGRTGLREKTVVLDIAKRLTNLLRADGINVVTTRSIDRFIPLSTRVSITNNSQADLFISIHANANRVSSLNGFEIYYVANSVSDTQRALSSARDDSLAYYRSCVAYPSLNLKATLWDMVYTQNRAESVILSRSICRLIGRDLDVRIIGIKGGRFYVLKNINIPAILIEVGFLSNYEEERFLKNSYYRQRVAQAIRDGILEYAQGLALAKNTN